MNDTPSNTLLSPKDRSSLQHYVETSPTEAPYRHRVQILLLADEGRTHEAIAVEAGVPIVQVRQLLRAFRRQGLTLFPPELLSPSPYSPETPIAEAGRQIMAKLLVRIFSYVEDLETSTSVTAVHESRKSIRRIRTALRLFSPYYEKDLMKEYRRHFRKFMDRLGRSRDEAVFLIKLDDYLARSAEADSLSLDEKESLTELRAYWEDRTAGADESVRGYLENNKFQKFLIDFERFARTEGERVRLSEDGIKPFRTRHIAPLMIGEKLAAVRAYADFVGTATPETLHALRIAFKELRYTLEFFESVLGPSAGTAIDTVKKLLTHLGDLNDARIHLEMLAKSNAEGLTPAVAHYRSVKQSELTQLAAEFPALWSGFDTPEWRQELYTAMAVL